MAQSTYSVDFTSGGIITVASAAVLNFGTSTDFTLSIWFKTSKSSGTALLLRKGINGGVSGYGFDVNGGALRGLVSDGSLIAPSAGSVADGAWHHAALVATRGGSTLVYLDGSSIASDTTPTGNVDVGDSLTFGNRSEADSGLAGYLDDIAFFDSALSGATIAAIADGSTDVATLSPIALWRLEEGTGGTAEDAINGNDGSITTAGWSSDVPTELAGGGGGVSVTPGTATLTLTTFAPTVQTPVTVTPGVANLVLTPQTPTVQTPVTCTPSTASLTTTGFSPTVVNPQSATPTTAALTLTTFAPAVTVGGNQVATPDTATLTITTYAPTIGGSQTAMPDTAALAITTYAPTVSTPQLVTPGAASLSLATFAPTILTPVLCTPSTRALTLTRYAPSVSNGELEATLVGQWTNVIQCRSANRRIECVSKNRRIDTL